MPPCRAAPLGCSATTLGACFIGPYQKVPTNAKTQRSYPDFFVRRNGRLGKAETCPSSSHRSSFQSAPPRTSLQSTSTLPFAAHVCSSLEPHFEPFTSCSFCPDDRPCPIPAHGARISRSAPAFLRRDGSGSTTMVSILNKRSCCWVLQLRPRSDFGRLVHPRSKRLGGGRTLSDRARRVLHL